MTGASGYVGTHVVNELDSRRIPATLLSRSRHDIASSSDNHFALAGEPETLIHLAWGGLPNYRSDRHVEVELPAQTRFLEHMLASGVRNLLVTGTCLEYGMQSGQLSESLPAQPTTAYAMAKNRLRERVEESAARHGAALTWARLFYSWGHGQSPNSLWPQLNAAVAAGERTFKMSGGEQQRDYLRAEDQARLLVDLAMTGRGCGVVNVCSGKPITVRALVEGWIRDNGWTIDLELGHYPYPDYEPMAFWGDRSKLDRLINGVL